MLGQYKFVWVYINCREVKEGALSAQNEHPPTTHQLGFQLELVADEIHWLFHMNLPPAWYKTDTETTNDS